MTSQIIPPQRGKPRYIYLEDIASPGEQLLSDPATGSLAAPVDFGFKTDDTVGSERWLRIERITFVGFRTNSNCPPDTFFGVASLPNGLLIEILDENNVVQEDFGTGLIPVRLHHDLGIMAGVDVDRDVQGAKTVVSIRWTLSAAGESTVLNPGWTFRIRVQDDLSDINKLTVMIQGLETPIT